MTKFFVALAFDTAAGTDYRRVSDEFDSRQDAEQELGRIKTGWPGARPGDLALIERRNLLEAA